MCFAAARPLCLTCTWKRNPFARPFILLKSALGEGCDRARACRCNTSPIAITIVELFLETFWSTAVEFLTHHLRCFMAPVITAHFPPLTLMVDLHSPRTAASSIVQPDWVWTVSIYKINILDRYFPYRNKNPPKLFKRCNTKCPIGFLKFQVLLVPVLQTWWGKDRPSISSILKMSYLNI